MGESAKASSKVKLKAKIYKTMMKAEEDEEEDTDMKADLDYGWVIVAVAFFVIFIPDGILVAFGGFVPSLQREFSADGSTLSLAASLLNGTKSLFGLVVSSLMDRFGFVKVIIAM